MEIIIQNIMKQPIQKEKIEIDTKKSAIFTLNACQPVNTLNLRGKMYVYVDFEFMVKVDDKNDCWIIPKK